VTECGGDGGDDDSDGDGGDGVGGGGGIGRCASRWTATRTCASPASGTPSSPSERPPHLDWFLYAYLLFLSCLYHMMVRCSQLSQVSALPDLNVYFIFLSCLHYIFIILMLC
jgi:hypothetical protein